MSSFTFTGSKEETGESGVNAVVSGLFSGYPLCTAKSQELEPEVYPIPPPREVNAKQEGRQSLGLEEQSDWEGGAKST